MTRVGIRKLKDKLSRYLGRARRGETIVVTVRGQDAVKISPIEVRVEPPSLDQVLARLAADGHLRLGQGRMGHNTPVPSTGIPASQIIIEERE